MTFIEYSKNSKNYQSSAEEFLREIEKKEYDENEGESTENEGGEEAEESESVEINDL